VSCERAGASSSARGAHPTFARQAPSSPRSRSCCRASGTTHRAVPAFASRPARALRRGRWLEIERSQDVFCSWEYASDEIALRALLAGGSAPPRFRTQARTSSATLSCERSRRTPTAPAATGSRTCSGTSSRGRLDGRAREWIVKAIRHRRPVMTARHAEGTASAQRELWGKRARDWASMQEGQARPLFERASRRCGSDPGRASSTSAAAPGCSAGWPPMRAQSSAATTRHRAAGDRSRADAER